MDIEEYLKDIYEETTERIDRSIELINKHKGCIPRIYRLLEEDEKSIGMLEYCYHNNIRRSKVSFYKSTIAREWTYNAYEKKEYEIDKNYITTYVYKSLFNAVLSGSKERVIYMANLFGGRIEEEKDDFLPNILLGYGLKYVILDNKQECYRYINQLEENKDKRGMKQYYNGYYKVYKGIIDRNEEMFNDGLLFMLKNHKQRMKKNGNTLEQYFAYDSIALSMIAKDRGINITVKHEMLPMEYLEPVDLIYSEIKLF